MQLTSSAFREGETIPKQYTCDGADISPPLSWESVPEEAESLVLIADDPDAPTGTWVHWVLYDLPPDVKELPEGISTNKSLDYGVKQGSNDFKKIGYGGPCPPDGTHRYYFKLYALDKKIDIEPGATKAQVEEAMKGHVLAQGQLMGKYSRK